MMQSGIIPDYPTLDSKAVDLITTDFRKIYDVYLFQLGERSSALRYYIAVLSAPFLIISGAGVLAGIGNNPVDLFAMIDKIPKFLYIPFFLCGGIGTLVFRMFWSAHCEVYKTTRYMNNFRKLYKSYFQKQFDTIEWSLYIESDPEMPVPGKIWSWTSSILLSMLVVNIGYVYFGYYLFRTSHDTFEYWAFLAIIALTCLVLHIYIYRECLITRGKDEPAVIQRNKKKNDDR